jgi:hypothetical protein
LLDRRRSGSRLPQFRHAIHRTDDFVIDVVRTTG